MAETLAVRLPNWVGDVVMALPSLGRLHDAGFRLACFGRGWASDLLAGCPWTVEALPRGTLAAARCLRASGARRGVLFPNSLGSALSMRLAGIRAAGYAGEGRTPLLGLRLRRPPGLHEAEVFFVLAAAAVEAWEKGEPTAFARSDSGKTRPLADARGSELGIGERIVLPLAERHHREAGAALAAAGVTGPFAVVCPLARGSVKGRAKVWPFWREFCGALAARGVRLAACPGPGETAACRELAPEAALLEGLGLGAYAAVLARARFAVANDSGPMHLADAAGTPTLGLFGVTDPARTRPWGGRHLGSAAGWPSLDEVLAAFDSLSAGS